MGDNKETIEKVEALLEHLKNGETQAADLAIKNLTHQRETDLFSEIGKLTRELHDTLNNFRLDSRISDLAAQDIPDAKDRLEYVLKMTDEAANKTMDAVESSTNLSKQIASEAKSLHSTWAKVNRKETNTGEFKIFFESMGQFLIGSQDKTSQLSSDLTEILMAQDFQDLTGQVIKKVITLVHDVEQSLVHTISMFGDMDEYKQAVETGKEVDAGVEGPIIDASKRDDVITNQDDVDDLLSSLGF